MAQITMEQLRELVRDHTPMPQPDNVSYSSGSAVRRAATRGTRSLWRARRAAATGAVQVADRAGM